MGKQMGVAIAGCGVVGGGVAKMLTDNADVIARAAGRAIALKYMVDIRTVDAPAGVVVTADFDRVLADPEVNVLVETIGGTRIAYEYTKKALARGISVVTSNKELVATHGEALDRIARENGARYLREASVGGGVPILHPIENCLAGNHLTRVDGIVNGSTNYLLTRMEALGIGFPAALGEAKALGYVEANPAADVEGWDARRKILILAHAAFGARLADDSQIPTEGISRLMERDLKCMRALGGAVKLIAHAQRTEGGWTGWVNPAFVPQGHPLYGVGDVFNGICVTGDAVGEVMFYGRGAGALPTASAVVGDLIDVAKDGVGNPSRFEQAIEFKSDGGLGRYIARIESDERIEGAKLREAGGMRAIEWTGTPGDIEPLVKKGVEMGIPLRML